MNKTKKVLIVTLSLVAILSIFLTYKAYMNKPVMLDDIKYSENTINKKKFGIFVEKDSYSSESDKYEIYSGTTWPSSGYEFNSTLSTCVDENGETISNALSINNSTITLTSTKTAYCYVYFDKSQGLELALNNSSFSWNNVEGAVSYNIYVDNNLVTNTSSQNIDLYKYLNSGGTYSVVVSALDNSNNETFSDPITYTVSQLQPTSKTEVDVENQNTGNHDDCPASYTYSYNFPDFDRIYVLDVEKMYDELHESGTCEDSEDVWLLDTNPLNSLNCGYFYNYVDTNFCQMNPDYCVVYNSDNSIQIGETYFIDANTFGGLEKNGSYIFDKLHNNILLNISYATSRAFVQFEKDGMIRSNWLELFSTCTCVTGDTDVYIYDEKKKKFKKKKIKDINYDDNILVWDFDNGQFAIAKPLCIKKKEINSNYHRLEFDDGSILKIINNHRIFNKEAGKFTPANDSKLTPIGTTTFNANGKFTKLVKRETIIEEVEYYNVVTNYHLNLFTSDILTSCRLNNIYTIEDMKFIKDNRKLNKIDNFKTLSKKHFEGFRVAEQPLDINRDGGSLSYTDIEDYINNNFLKKEIKK